MGKFRFSGTRYRYRAKKEEKEILEGIFHYRLKKCDEYFSNNIEDKLETSREGYEVGKPATNLELTDEENRWRCKLKIPKGFELTQLAYSMIGDREIKYDLEATTRNGEILREANKKLIQYAQNRCKFNLFTNQGRLGALKDGSAWWQVYWRYDKSKEKKHQFFYDDEGGIDMEKWAESPFAAKYKEEEIVKFDDVWVDIVSPYDMRYPANYGYVEKLPYIFRRKKYLNWDVFKQAYGKYPNFKYVRPGNFNSHLADSLKWNENDEDQDLDDESQGIEVWEYFDKINNLWQICANGILLTDPNNPLPTPNGELPFGCQRYMRQSPYMMEGFGIPYVIDAFVRELSTLRRGRIDQMKMNLFKMWLVAESADINEEDLRPSPNGMIKVGDTGMPLRDVLRPLEFSGLKQEAYHEDQFFLKEITDLAGVSGAEVLANASSATQAMEMRGVMNKKLEHCLYLNEIECFDRIGELLKSYIDKFYPRKPMKVFSVMGEDKLDEYLKKKGLIAQYNNDLMGDAIVENEEGGYDIAEYRIFKVGELDGQGQYNMVIPEMLEEKFIIKTMSQTAMPESKAVERRQFLEFAQIVSSNPMFQQQIDPLRLLEAIVERYDYDKDKYLKTRWFSVEGRKQAEREQEALAQGLYVEPNKEVTSPHLRTHYAFLVEQLTSNQISPENLQNLTEHIAIEQMILKSLGREMPPAETDIRQTTTQMTNRNNPQGQGQGLGRMANMGPNPPGPAAGIPLPNSGMRGQSNAPQPNPDKLPPEVAARVMAGVPMPGGQQ